MKHIVALLAGLAVILGVGLAMIPAQADLTARALAPAPSFEPVAMTEPNPYGEELDTIYIPAGHVSDAMFDALLQLGYEGDPSDGVEALYPTRMDALSSCYSDRDCYIADWSVSVQR